MPVYVPEKPVRWGFPYYPLVIVTPSTIQPSTETAIFEAWSLVNFSNGGRIYIQQHHISIPAVTIESNILRVFDWTRRKGNLEIDRGKNLPSELSGIIRPMQWIYMWNVCNIVTIRTWIKLWSKGLTKDSEELEVKVHRQLIRIPVPVLF